ncbi:MAG: hypothetical protein ABWK01_00855 [Infirmifilum sp.]
MKPTYSVRSSSENLIFTYHLFNNISKALLTSLELLKTDSSSTSDSVTLSILLLFALRISLGLLRNNLRDSSNLGREEVNRIVYGYIARAADLAKHLKDFQEVPRGPHKPTFSQSLHVILEEALRLENELERFDKLIDDLLEKP